MANDIVSQLNEGFKTKPGWIVNYICQFIVALICLDLVIHTTGATQLICGTSLVLYLTVSAIEIFKYISRKANQAGK